MIDENLLLSYGAEFEQFAPRDVIFEEGDTPKFFYQIIKGRIKLNHFDESGKELILAILEPGLSVCELLLFIDEKYPVNAVVFEAEKVFYPDAGRSSECSKTGHKIYGRKALSQISDAGDQQLLSCGRPYQRHLKLS